MNHSSPLETATPVHSMDALLQYRKDAFAREQGILSAVSVLGQSVIGAALYLYGHVGTPGYLSILLTVPWALLIAALSLYLIQHAKDGAVLEAAGKTPGKIFPLMLFPVFFLDAQLAAYAISAILSDALPRFSPLLTMLAVALIMAAAMGGENEYALPRLAGMLRWPLLIALFYCGLTALPHGSPGYLFPLLGRGTGSIFQGALWMGGCTAGACCPLLIPSPCPSLSPFQKKGRMLYRPLLGALLAAALYALISACLLPAYSLARPENLGFRLLLFTKISGSSLAWSLLVFAQLFLLLLTLAAGIMRCAHLLTGMAGKRKPSPLLTGALLLLLVPAAALKTLPVQDALIRLAPFRGAAVMLVLIPLCIFTWIRERRKQA